MDYRIRTALLKVLSRLPRRVGDYLYHRIQEIRGTDICSPLSVKRSRLFFTEIRDALEKMDTTVDRKVWLELGSGWTPIIPLFCVHEADSPKVYTYDINQHYTSKRVKRATRLFFKELGVPMEAYAPHGALGLPEQIVYRPLTNIVREPPTGGAVDIAFSRNVLEHVSPEDLISIHESSKSWIKKNGWWYHGISCNDHRSYSDKGLSLYDFLRYSPQEWDQIQTRFDYHNRLRLPQYVEIFERTSWQVVHISSHSSESQKNQVRNVKLHKDFARFSETELAAGSVRVILKNA